MIDAILVAARDMFVALGIFMFSMFSVALVATAVATPIDDYEVACTKAKESGKRVLVVLSTDRCLPCIKLEAALKSDPEMKYIAGLYEVVKVKVVRDGTIPVSIMRIMNDNDVKSFPFTISIDPETDEYGACLFGFSRDKFVDRFDY